MAKASVSFDRHTVLLPDERSLFVMLLPRFSEAFWEADDAIAFPMGDPREASTSAAIDYLVGRSCTSGAIAFGAGPASAGQGGAARALLSASAPNAAQLQVPGLF